MTSSDKLKPGWTKVKFGEVVRLCKDRSSDPEADGIERYVGLEHLETEDLRIQRWGLVADGTTFTNLFKPGQVLFGKRRAYQRKVAVADFVGVCSGDIYIFETADPKHLLPELLPFICQTARFFEYAVGTSAGSLSPRTNWNKLRNYEINLPSLEEQREIYFILEAYQNVYEKHRDNWHFAERALTAALWHIMRFGISSGSSQTVGGLTYSSDWPIVGLKDIALVERGKFSHRPRNLPEFYGGPYPFVQTGDVGASRGELDTVSQTLSEEGLQYSRSFPKDTILITIAAVIGATAITTRETWCTDSVVGVVPGKDTNVRFLEYVFRYLRPYLEIRIATQTAQKNINLAVLRPLSIPHPKKDMQDEIASRLLCAERAVDSCESHYLRFSHLFKAFLEKTLSGYTL